MATQPDDNMRNVGDIPLNDDAYEVTPMSQPDRLWDADHQEDEAPARGPRILWIAGLLSIVWLAAAAALFWLIGQEMSPAAVTLTEWAAIAAGLCAPLTAIWLIALIIARIDPGRGRETLARLEAAELRFAESAAGVRAQVDGIDHMLLAVSERLDALGASLTMHGSAFEDTTARAAETARTVSSGLAEDRERLDEVMSRLAERGEVTHAQLSELAKILPDAETQAERIGTSLEGHGRAALMRIDELEGRLSALDDRERLATQGAMTRASTADDLLAHIDRTTRDVETLMQERGSELTATVDAALGRATASLDEHRERLRAEIENASTRTAAALDQTRGDLNAEIDGSLSRTAHVLEQARTGLSAQADALNAAIEQANFSLENTGRTAAAEIETRLAELSARAGSLALEFAKQDENSAALFDASESRFAAFENRLGETTAQGSAMLSDYERRVHALRGETDALASPLSETRGLVSALESGIGSIRSQLGETLSAFETQLPEMSAESQAGLSRLQEHVAALRQEFAELGAQTDRLSAPVENARGSIGGAIAELDQARGALEETTGKLGEDLERASASINATRDMAEGTALGAASQLIEALGRVRDVAGQASESVRATLSGVVDEAVEAIGRASGEAVRTNALGPVEEQLGQLETISKRSADAANDAAERLSRSLVSVAETAAAVEARVKEADEHLDRAQKNDLSQQSNLLIEALNSNAIDITKTLSTEVTEAAWRDYSSGDRSVFTRRASRLVGNTTAKDIARHYEEEPEFRDAVRRYIHDFEAMMRRVMQDRDGDSFSIALLSSDVGKLYVALAQSTDRLRAKG